MYSLIRDAAGVAIAFVTLDDQQAGAALHEAWAPSHLAKFNAEHERCDVCDGWGSLRVKQGSRMVRENVGCPQCHGLGVVPKPKLWEGRI